ncbi:glycoside hydrolase family 25 protein [Streptomyces sp. NBC_00557]|uniref:glycoside hydrolase family 25 protein n=1 Tax=Streptomyces sp. NBC_00557 TaxID=2975776 RepID=UPI002E81E2D5|nr:glycoside hydrolase family 25 protein [Streptomyces sp. NBC_00557]WUC36415.1 glycoside hydrolase family 25 protein [Streptomyces sp. NBC_00557]
MATCRGMDVSAYQGTQDWAALRRSGLTFAFAKATEGLHTVDPKFATHIKGILAAGLVAGSYHFGWPTQDPKAEAAHYIATVKPYAKAGYTHWLDLERYSDGRNYRGRNNAEIRAWATTWIHTVQAAFPNQRVGIYTSADDIAAGRAPADVPLWYPAYPWGEAAYSRAEAASQPRPSGRAPLIWQFTSKPVDRSIAYLSEADFRAWAGGGTHPEETDMQPTDEIAVPAWAKTTWPKDTGLADGKIQVQTALASGYAHSRKAAEQTTAILAQLGAQAATIDKLVTALGAGGGLTAEEIKAAAEAGAQAALAKLGEALQS